MRGLQTTTRSGSPDAAARARRVQAHHRRAPRALMGGVLTAVLATSPAIGPALPARAAGTVTVTALKLPFGAAGGAARAINDRGDIVGTSSHEVLSDIPRFLQHAEYWGPDGRQIDLNPPLSLESSATSVNRNGMILGHVGASTVWIDLKRTQVAPLACLGLQSCGWYAAAINDNDQVAVSRSFFRNGRHLEVALWQNGTLSPWVDGGDGRIVGMNAAGTLVGQLSYSTSGLPGKVFTVSGTTVTDLPTHGWPAAQALSINDQGQVLGEVGDPDLTGRDSTVHSVIWQNGQMTDLGTLGGKRTYVSGHFWYLGIGGTHTLNNRGQVVGTSELADGTHHAFLWQDGRMTDLNVDSADPATPTWSESGAINDLGEIIGYGGSQKAGFAWRDGSVTWLPGSVLPQAINNSGVMAGTNLDRPSPVRITISP